MPIRKYLPFAIVGLLAINLPIFIFLSQHQQDIRQNASETISCTSVKPEKIGNKLPSIRKAISATYSAQLKALVTSYRNADTSSRTKIREEMHQVLDARKTALIQTMRSDPKAALKELKSTQNTADLDSLTSNCVEKPTQISGTVHVEHADYKDKTSEDILTLITKDNRTFTLHNPSNYPRQLYSGAQLTTYGYALDQEFLVSSDQPTVLTNDTPPLLQSNALTVRKIAVILVNFSDTTKPSISQSEVTSTFSDINAFYKENSYGKVSFSPTIYGWYQLTIPTSCSNTPDISNAAMKAANNDANFLSFDNIMIIAPFSNCSWGGLGDVGSYTRSTPDGQKLVSFSFINASPFIAPPSMEHELGHNLGSYHAGMGTEVYGDLYDVMGGFTGEMNAAHKDIIGVFPSGALQTVTTNGSYSLLPLESQGTGVKGIKLNSGTSGIYYLEFRQALGADSVYNQQLFPGNTLYNGVLIHKYIQPVDNTVDTQLIDPHLTQNAETASLKTNETYTIPGSNVRIKTTGVTSSGATVSITGVESVTPNPTATPFLTPTPVVAQADIIGTFYVDNNSNSLMDTGDFVYTTPTKVELRKDDGSNSYPNLLRTATSSEVNGRYTFTNLPTGYYKLTALVQSAYTVSTGNPVYVHLTTGSTLDFGLKQASVILTPTPTRSPSMTPTPTPTRTPSPTISQNITPLPTATPMPNSIHLVASLLLHGIGKAGDNTSPGGLGTQNPHTPSVNAALTFKNITTSSQLNLLAQFKYNPSDGSFITDFYTPKLSAGKYTITVTIPKYLQATSSHIITIQNSQTNIIPPIALIVGDTNSDNRINVLDYDILIGCLQKTVCSQNEHIRSDLNDDGIIDQDDLNLFLREINVYRGDSL